MSDTEQTRAAGSGKNLKVDKPVRAKLCIERRMGKSVSDECVTILLGSQMLVGRDPACEIHIPDDRISRKHALFSLEMEGVRLSDLGSTNGTTRNGESVKEEIIVETGDKINFGLARTFESRVVVRDGSVTSLRLASGREGYLLSPQEFVIGHAGPKIDLVDLPIYDPTIGPVHARIEYFTGQTFIVALDSERPVTVNSKPVKEMEIRNGYFIEIGDTLFRFERE